ncbi:MAG TPA: MotA/TolQ/ExbB proton channel family protein [Candidatus Hydrogenedentes bacterium]|nr:MotA/TolQ/ExbB proton channel family protein [Candidatus Hydrogenedentota bacterium]
MDIATIIGFVAGIFLVAITIFMGGNVGVFFNAPSFILVAGGTLAATLINFPLSDVLSVFTTVKNSFIQKASTPERLIEHMVEMCIVARREGILALESYVKNTQDEFLERSLQLAIDGTPSDLLKDILTSEIAFMEDRHTMGQSILSAMALYSPAFGLIGTVIGLIQMLTTMDDPSKVGSGMAVALITTLYGVIMANVLFLPTVGKLRVRTAIELLHREIIIEGILSIQSGDNPRILENKLKSFVSPAIRARVRKMR